jgi:hypothetical protein
MGRFWRWARSSWRIMIIRLIAIIGVIMIVSGLIYPLDPADLDYKLKKINVSSFQKPALAEMMENITGTFASEDVSKNGFQEEWVFRQILSNDTILKIVIKDEKLFKNSLPTFDNESSFSEIFNQSSNYYLYFNDSHIIEYILMDTCIIISTHF